MSFLQNNRLLVVSTLLGLVPAIYASTLLLVSAETTKVEFLQHSVVILSLISITCVLISWHIYAQKDDFKQHVSLSFEKALKKYATQAGFSNSKLKFEDVHDAIEYLEAVMPSAKTIKNTRLATSLLAEERKVSAHDAAIIKAIDNGAAVTMLCTSRGILKQNALFVKGRESARQKGDLERFRMLKEDFNNAPMPQITILGYKDGRPKEVLIGWRMAERHSGNVLLLRGDDVYDRFLDIFERYCDNAKLVTESDFV